MSNLEKLIRFFLKQWWLIVLAFFLVPVLVNILMKPFWSLSSFKAEGDINSWINFWGNYSGTTIGAIVGGLVAYKIARSQIEAQSVVEMSVLKKNKLFDIRYKFITDFSDKYVFIFNDIIRFNTVAGSILAFAENYKNVTDKVSAGKEFENSALNADKDIRETLLRIYTNGTQLPSIIELNKMHIPNKIRKYTIDDSEKTYIEIINSVLIINNSVLYSYSTNCSLLFSKILPLSEHIVKGLYEPIYVIELNAAKQIHADLVIMATTIKQNIEPIIIDLNEEIIKELG